MHPSPEQLRDYACGQLPADAVQEIEDHLRECRDCEHLLSRCEQENDALVAQLRHAPEPAAMAMEPALARGLAGIKGLMQSSGTLEDSRVSIPSKLLVSQSVRDYQILDVLGSGGMGTVYRALHTRLGREVALKVLSAERALDRKSRDRFDREMKAIGKLSHTNIVTALDAGDADGVRYLVMELVDGADLATIVSQQQRLQVADACEVIRQAAFGLHYAHQQGIVHRDLKPSNLMLGRMPTGRVVVKILDLGLALLHGIPVEGGHAITSTGQIMGTLEYLSPEQASDAHAVDAKSDIYSLGSTLYKLLSGQTPFEGVHSDSTVKKLLAIAQTEPKPLQSLRPDCPAKLCAIVHLMLAKQPKRRPSPAQLTRLLAPFNEGHDLKGILDSIENYADQLISDEKPARQPDSPTSNKAREETAATFPPDAPADHASPPTAPVTTPQFASFTASPETELPPVVRRSKKKRAPARNRGWLPIGIVLSILFITIVSGVTYWLRTNQGLVKVEIHDPDLAVELREAGLVIRDAAANRQWTINVADGSVTGSEEIPPGSYEVVTPDGAQLIITDDSGATTTGTGFRLLRQGEVRIAITTIVEAAHDDIDIARAQPVIEPAPLDVAQLAINSPAIAAVHPPEDSPEMERPEPVVVAEAPDDAPPVEGVNPAMQVLNLSEFDPEEAVFAGTWRIRGDELHVPGDALPTLPRMTLPFDVPVEYELRMTVMKDGPEGVHLGLVVGGRQVLLPIDSFHLLGGRCGLQQVDGLNTLNNPDTLVGMQLQQDGHENELACRVTRTREPDEYHIELIIDEELIFEWTGQATRLTNHPAWSVPENDRLFLGGSLTPVRLKEIELRTLKSDAGIPVD